MHDYPGFGVVERMSRTFVASEVSCFMVNKSGRESQTCAASNSVSDLADGCRAGSQQIFRERRDCSSGSPPISTCLLSTWIELKYSGEAFVEPSLSGRIVEVQQADGEIVRDRAPGFFF